MFSLEGRPQGRHVTPKSSTEGQDEAHQYADKDDDPGGQVPQESALNELATN